MALIPAGASASLLAASSWSMIRENLPLATMASMFDEIPCLCAGEQRFQLGREMVRLYDWPYAHGDRCFAADIRG